MLAPWSYQPHYVQHVDPNTGVAKKIIAVPAGRYEGNENARGGYGAFKPENVWGSHVDKNNNASKPMLLLCHSDGDNYGMKNADAWGGQHQNFVDMCASNPDFEYTSVQDYLALYPPATNDIIHVEPGSWVGIDGGTPYFEKWLSYESRDGVMPDMWSWSVLIAGQNRVLTADALENSYLNLSGGRTMDDVEWGLNNDTARAWRYYLAGETSCYWYWDFDTANPWDGNVTRAMNLSIAEANKVLARHPGSDPVGPSIFPPQHTPYNPGGKMWNETTNSPSDFQVWSFVDDVSGVADVRLYWRRDLDGINPINEFDNEVYAHNPAKVTEWTVVPMAGDWWPSVKGSNVPEPSNRAQRYMATVSGQNNALIDYFVEAVDTKGNINRSDILHVWVGESSGAPTPVSPVTFSADPRDCAPLTVTYDATGRNLEGVSPVYQQISFNNGSTWTRVTMTSSGGNVWTADNTVPDDAPSAIVWFENSDGSLIDSNDGANWTTAIRDCDAPVIENGVSINPNPAQAGQTVTVTYDPSGRILASAAEVNIHYGHNDSNWTTAPGVSMTKSGSYWTYTYTVPANSSSIVMCFNDGTTWDNNNEQNWTFAAVGGTGDPDPDPEPTGVVSISSAGACDPITITYNPDGRPLASASTVKIHIGRNGWTDAIEPNPSMTKSGSVWTYLYTPLPGTTNINMVFNNGADLWDNNSEANWNFAITPCPELPTGLAITNPVTDISVPFSTESITLQGIADGITGNLAWTNALTHASGTFAAASPWTLANVALAVGANPITVSGTKVIPGGGGATIASDSAANAVYAEGWPDASNGGSGFGAWTLNAVEGSSGHFANENGWGMWSHQDTLAEAIRSFSAPIGVGETVEVFMQNNWIWEGEDDGQGGKTGVGGIGFTLLNNADDEFWKIYFNGGNDHYTVTDSPGEIDWTEDGLQVAFTVTSAGNYSVDITPVGGTKRTYIGTFTGTITGLRAWSFSNGTDDGQNSNRDFFINNLKVLGTGEGSEELLSDTVTITRQATAAEAPDITGIGLQGGGAGGLNLFITESQVGVTYAIWESPTLDSPQVWKKVEDSEIIGTGNALDLPIPTPLLPLNFYRIGIE